MRNSKLFREALLNFFQMLFILSSVFFIVYFFVAQLLEVTGDSMYPNFHDKEQIVAEKISIISKTIKRGDIVIFKHPFERDKLLIKRVIGLPGERLVIMDGRVYINGAMLYEPYLSPDTKTKGGKLLEDNAEYTIRNHAYVVLGDNRGESTDSREWGYLNEDLIVAKGVLIYYPFKDFRFITGVNY